MKEFVEGLVEPILKIIGFPAAVFAAWASIKQFVKSNEEKKRANAEAARANAERDRANRHRQAAASLAALKDVFADERARAAMQMLDWSGRSFQDGAEVHTVEARELRSALRIDNLTFTPKERYIRDCFEALFDHLELAEHCVQIGLFDFTDISVPLAYYCRKVDEAIADFSPFLDNYGYPRARKFIHRAAASGQSDGA